MKTTPFSRLASMSDLALEHEELNRSSGFDDNDSGFDSSCAQPTDTRFASAAPEDYYEAMCRPDVERERDELLYA